MEFSGWCGCPRHTLPCLIYLGSQSKYKITVEGTVTNDNKITIQVALLAYFRKYLVSIILLILQQNHEVETKGNLSLQYISPKFKIKNNFHLLLI